MYPQMMPYDQAALAHHASLMVNVLSETDVRRALGEAVMSHASTLFAVRNLYDQYISSEQQWLNAENAQVIDFSPYGTRARLAIFTSGCDDDDYERGLMGAYDACDEIVKLVVAILDQVQLTSSYGTKRSALATLCNIGWNIMVEPPTEVREVRKRTEDEIPKAMLTILNGMSGDERIKLALSKDAEGSLYDRIYELARDALSYGFWKEEMSLILELLGGRYLEDEEHGDDDDDSTSEYGVE